MRAPIPPVIQFAVCAGIGWWLAFLAEGLNYFWFAGLLFGTALTVGGLSIILISVAAFFRERTTINPLDPTQAQALVTTGLYRFTRNPMYLGLAVMLCGGAFLLSNFAAFVAPSIFVVAMTILQIKPEETALREKFGTAYDAYCERTRRWI